MGNVVVQGITVGSDGALYLKGDSVTQGNWVGVYGIDGYNIVGDTSSYPAYISSVTPTRNTLNNWATDFCPFCAGTPATHATRSTGYWTDSSLTQY